MRARLVLLLLLVALAAMAAAPAGLASGRNPQTAGLQVALRAQGLYRGAIDAISGPETVAAVRAFQRIHGLRVTGLADARTRAAFGPLGRPLFGARTLHRGAFGWDVAVLQFMLVRQGISVPVNAYFDAPTLHGVRLLQHRLHLRRDGVVGPHTLSAIARREPVPLAGHVVIVARHKHSSGGDGSTSSSTPATRSRHSRGGTTPRSRSSRGSIILIRPACSSSGRASAFRSRGT
jgi:Putative peptidoglycan-binding domain-containing protein